jgi:hypothetical protein
MHGAGSPVFACQCCQQRFGLLEIRRIEALGEPAIDRRQQRLRFSLLTLLLPEASKAHGGPQLRSLCANG